MRSHLAAAAVLSGTRIASWRGGSPVATVEALGPADLAAIVHSGVGSAQNFTGDRTLPFSAIDASAMGFADGEEWLTSSPMNRSFAPGVAPQATSRGRCPLGKCTCEAIIRIAESLRNLPRRKSLILIAPQVLIQEFEDTEIKRDFESGCSAPSTSPT